MVEEGAGVAVSAATVFADVSLFFCAAGAIILGIGNALRDMRQRWRNLLGHPFHPQALSYS